MEEQSEGSKSTEQSFTIVLILSANGSFPKSGDIVVLKTCNFVVDAKFIDDEVVSSTKGNLTIAQVSTFALILTHFDFLVASLLSVGGEEVAFLFICG